MSRPGAALSCSPLLFDGRSRRVSATENPELLWAIRGGGTFGGVTSFDFALHPVGSEVLSGFVVHPFAEAGQLLRDYRDLAAVMPDGLTVWVAMRQAPPLPFLPEEWHGREILIFAACYAGAIAEGEKALAPLRALGKPIGRQPDRGARESGKARLGGPIRFFAVALETRARKSPDRLSSRGHR